MIKDKKTNRYNQLIEKVFFDNYREGSEEVLFDRAELERGAATLKLTGVKNIGDILYSFRSRTSLPTSILEKATQNKVWIIEGVGKSKYRFRLTTLSQVVPREDLAQTKVPDSTPGIIALYTQGDEQALLAKLRYNRLLDIFTGITCYSLQNHLRTTVQGIGQVEVDELYAGIDERGAHFIIPVQAKGGKDKITTVQILQDYRLCQEKYPDLIALPIAAQFIDRMTIALFLFRIEEQIPRVVLERHYKLVPPDEIDSDLLESYRASHGSREWLA